MSRLFLNYSSVKMEDDDEVASRKRRRRSIRNLRRKSGVVPFCLNEEKIDIEPCESSGKFQCAEPVVE